MKECLMCGKGKKFCRCNGIDKTEFYHWLEEAGDPILEE